MFHNEAAGKLPVGVSDVSPTGPLAGIVIADFSRVLAGPYCTMLLADMGATVIKVESPHGDDTRHWTPPERDGESVYYLSVNRNKHSIALDLADESDRTIARGISERADVFVENFRAGGLKKFGLDYDGVSAINPSVIYASITGFGTGAGADLPGYDLLIQAGAGLMSITGPSDGPPYRSGVAVFDVMTGLHAATGILAALHHRSRTGEGQLLEMNLLSSALSGMVNQSMSPIAGGVVPHRAGNSHPSIYPYDPMPTSDGTIIIAIGNDGQFARLCEGLAIPRIAQDPRFATAPERNVNRDALQPLLHERLQGATSAEWFTRLSALGVPCAPINSVDEGIELASRLGLDPVVWTGEEGRRRIPTVRNPVRLARTPVDYRLPPPLLDGDRESVQRWLSQNSMKDTDREDPR